MIGPVPRCLHDRLRRRVLDDDGRLVVHTWIDGGLVTLRDRRHAQGALVVEQPRRDVGAIAAEVVQRAPAVAHRVRQPVEELGLRANLLGPEVAVHGDDLPDAPAGLLLVHQAPHGAMTAVPRGLVVDQHVDLAALRRGRDGLGVGGRHGQGLLHHDVHAVPGGGLDDLQVVEGVGVDDKRLRPCLRDEEVEVGEHPPGVDRVLRGELVAQRGVGVVDADQFDVGPLDHRVHVAAHVPVDEAHHGDTQGLAVAGR